ncbi:probable long-chain-alcohol O-fatty-acyltransferase 3 isoform X2 [Prosopis cineraria]|uniref:probable long-chain-alcohol O-fatty-acyltransferase 3 isoform X2 n=1 Tax=Prosopis cineraria TaxID=364024 RepID=UPI0024104DB1|nr:probable long-chain-alcohol O-fatty-acyltransferase 3 isoform X2 [Prosopis cineraria]
MSRPKCMHEETHNLIKLYITVFLSLSYCFFIASRIPKGLIALFITWLSTLKLVLFAFDSGPLSSPPARSLPIFILISCLPIKTGQNPKKTPKLPLNLPIKTLLFLLLLPTVNHKQNLHPKLLLAIYCCLLYLLVDVVSGICNSVTKAVVGMELEMPSDEPYLSTSLQDFWGRRWNLMVTNVLRDAVYEPASSICGPILGPQRATMLGIVAAFVVSGLMHELIFYYVTREAPTWEVTRFFALHGLCVVGEFGVKKLLGQPNWGVCSAVYGPLTVAFVIGTAHWLFFSPLVRNGADERAAKEFMNLLECMMGKVGLTQLHG